MSNETQELNDDNTRYVEAETPAQACEFIKVDFQTAKVEKIGKGRRNRDIYRIAA